MMANLCIFAALNVVELGRCPFGRDWFKVKINGQMQGRQGRGRRERTFVRDRGRDPQTLQMPVQTRRIKLNLNG